MMLPMLIRATCSFGRFCRAPSFPLLRIPVEWKRRRTGKAKRAHQRRGGLVGTAVLL